MTSSENTVKLDRLEIPESWPEFTGQSIDSHVELEDPKSATKWKMVLEPRAIEYYLMIRNYQHFGQSHGTPFTVEPLNQDIDWTATSAASEEILQGTYSQPTYITELCTQVLANCKRLYTDDSIPVEISELDFKGKVLSWNERTTTSPSGRHLGWYKSLYAAGVYEVNTPEHAEFVQKQKTIQ